MAKVKNDPEANDIYEAGKAFLQDIYKQVEAEDAKRASAPTEGEQAYKELLFKLEPEKDKYMSDVFRYFTQK